MAGVHSVKDYILERILDLFTLDRLVATEGGSDKDDFNFSNDPKDDLEKIIKIKDIMTDDGAGYSEIDFLLAILFCFAPKEFLITHVDKDRGMIGLTHAPSGLKLKLHKIDWLKLQMIGKSDS